MAVRILLEAGDLAEAYDFCGGLCANYFCEQVGLETRGDWPSSTDDALGERCSSCGSPLGVLVG